MDIHLLLLKQGAIQMSTLYFYSLRPESVYKVLEILLWWVGPSQQPNTQPASCSLPSFTRQGKKWTKARGLVYLDNNHFIGKAKAVVISQAKCGISSLLCISRHMSNQFLASRASAHAMLAWEVEFHHHNYLSFLLLALSFSSFSSIPSHGMEYFLVTLSLLCFPLSASLLPLNLLTFGCVWEEWKPWFCATTVQQ